MSENKLHNLVEVLRAADSAKDRTVSISGEMMKCAATFDDLEAFEVAMKAAETDRKVKINEKLVKAGAGKDEAKAALRLPPAWSQGKSNIRAIWKLGHHPKEFKSFSELTIELQKIRKDEKGSDKSPTQDAGEEVQALHTVTKGLTHKRRIENVVLSLIALSDGDQSEVLDEFEKVLKDYEPAQTATNEEELPVIESAGNDVEELEAAQIQQAGH